MGEGWEKALSEKRGCSKKKIEKRGEGSHFYREAGKKGQSSFYACREGEKRTEKISGKEGRKGRDRGTMSVLTSRREKKKKGGKEALGLPVSLSRKENDDGTGKGRTLPRGKRGNNRTKKKRASNITCPPRKEKEGLI